MHFASASHVPRRKRDRCAGCSNLELLRPTGAARCVIQCHLVTYARNILRPVCPPGASVGGGACLASVLLVACLCYFLRICMCVSEFAEFPAGDPLRRLRRPLLADHPLPLQSQPASAHTRHVLRRPLLPVLPLPLLQLPHLRPHGRVPGHALSHYTVAFTEQHPAHRDGRVQWHPLTSAAVPVPKLHQRPGECFICV